MKELPIWVTLSLHEVLTDEAFAARAVALGVRVEVAARGAMQLPYGFLAWIEQQSIPERIVDSSAAQNPVAIGPACLHISGGTNELEIRAHQVSPAVRSATAKVKAELRAITQPGDDQRIISGAALKVERLTRILRLLLPLAKSVILPQANHLSFPAEEFEERSRDYSGHYHFPLYTATKVRNESDGPFLSTAGMFLFGLPDVAMPYDDDVDPRAVSEALGQLMRELVAEGWWPESGEEFATKLGAVEIQRVQDALFVLPTEVELYQDQVAVARHRWAIQRCAMKALGDGTLHRMRSPHTSVVVDHYLLRTGSYAITNGVSLTAQSGGTAEEENEFVEFVLFSDQLGPWATDWLLWVSQTLLGHDGSHPIFAWGRVVREEPLGGIAGVLLWPWGYFTPFGETAAEAAEDDAEGDAEDDAEGVDDGSRSLVERARARVHLLCLMPITSAELSRFRSDPKNVEAWIAERNARDDVDEINQRWAAYAPKRPAI